MFKLLRGRGPIAIFEQDSAVMDLESTRTQMHSIVDAMGLPKSEAAEEKMKINQLIAEVRKTVPKRVLVDECPFMDEGV